MQIHSIKKLMVPTLSSRQNRETSGLFGMPPSKTYLLVVQWTQFAHRSFRIPICFLEPRTVTYVWWLTTVVFRCHTFQTWFIPTGCREQFDIPIRFRGYVNATSEGIQPPWNGRVVAYQYPLANPNFSPSLERTSAGHQKEFGWIWIITPDNPSEINLFHLLKPNSLTYTIHAHQLSDSRIGMHMALSLGIFNTMKRCGFRPTTNNHVFSRWIFTVDCCKNTSPGAKLPWNKDLPSGNQTVCYGKTQSE